MSIQPRVHLSHDASVPRFGTPIDYAVADFAASVVRQRALGRTITELVRLRCAGVHDCRLCGSLRDVDAGVDESAAAMVNDYETGGLDERTKVALRLTDAMILDPSAVDDTLRADARRLFSAEELAELLMDVVKWSQQKALVALRIEVAPRQGLSELRFDEQGRARIGAALPDGTA